MQVKSSKKGILIKSLLALIVILSALLAMFACKDETYSAVKITAITPYGDSFKDSYYVGESFAEGVQFLVEYEDRHSVLVDAADVEMRGFSSAKAGEISLSVTYGGKTVQLPIRIVALTATRLTLQEGSLPSVLYRGMALPSGGKLEYTLVNGASGTVDVTSDMVMGYEPLVVGKQMLTISYLGMTVHHLITVENDFVQSISLDGYFTEYNVGDAFNKSGAVLTLHYASGATATKQLTDKMISGFTTATGGLHTFTVTDMGCSCTCDYIVQARPQEAIFAVDVAERYERGDKFATQYLLDVVFDDASSGKVPVTADMLTGFDTSQSGTFTAKVNYYQFEFDYPYVVLADAVSLGFVNYTPCVRQGTVFDGIGNLTVYMQDGSSEEVPLSDEGVQIEGYDTSATGTVRVSITYRKCAVSFDVEVFSAEEEYAVQSLIFNGTLGSVLSGQEISTEGLTLAVNYKYLKPATVQLRPEMLSATSFVLSEGDFEDKTVTITYRNATLDVSVRVLTADYAAKVTALHVLSAPTLVAVGDTPDLSAALMTVIYGGGYRSETVKITAEMLGAYDLSQSGTQNVTVTYKGASTQFTLNVISESEKTQVTSISVQNFAPLVFVGDEVSALDVSGAELVVTYGNGYSVSRLPLSVDMLSGTFDRAGVVEVACAYGGKTTNILVNVYEKSMQTTLTGIAVNGALDGYIGLEPDFSKVGLVLTFGYGYSTDEIALSAEGVTIGDYNSAAAGTQYVTVSYGGCSCLLTLRLSSGSGDVVIGVEVAQSSKQTFSLGEAFGGITILVSTTSGRREVAATENMTNGFDTSAVGRRTLTVNYGGYTADWDYEVQE